MKKNEGRRKIGAAILVLILVVLACGLPQQTSQDPTPPQPTNPPPPTSEPTLIPVLELPPAVVETDPPAGSSIPVDGPLTFYFNQPMDLGSVEGALQGRPGLSGRFSWEDDATLMFFTDSPFPPGTDLEVMLNQTARAANGLALPEPISLFYRTAGPLEMTQGIPAPDAAEVNPVTPIIVAFNQPVVELGSTQDNLPEAILMDPIVSGRGEWVNTSTYRFTPDPPLAGGSDFFVRLNPDLESLTGTKLARPEDQPIATEWYFSTAVPRLVSVNPDPAGQAISLDAAFTLTFNQAMDPVSLANELALFDTRGKLVDGVFEWNEALTEVIFIPEKILVRQGAYVLDLTPQTRTLGGTILGVAWQGSYRTVNPLAVVNTRPESEGYLGNFENVRVEFNGPIEPTNLEAFIRLEPEVPGLNTFWEADSRTVFINGFFEADREYNLTISGDLSDPWGEPLGKPFQMDFRTEALRPNIFLPYGGSAIFLTPDNPRLTVQATNLRSVDLSLGSIQLEEFFELLGPDGYQVMDTFRASDSTQWTQLLELPSNRSTDVDLLLSPDGTLLAPGLYFLRIGSAELNFPPAPLILVVGETHLTLKNGPTDALLWAVALRSRRPLSQEPITIFNELGVLLFSGQTDDEGILLAPLPPRENPYETIYGMVGEPGEPGFGLVVSSWDLGVAGWDFGLTMDLTPPGYKAYLYTDRPIYRPGQIVNFRTILRWAENGRYRTPDLDRVLLQVFDSQGKELPSQVLTLSEFGTAYGEIALPDNAAPGYYRLSTDYGDVSFQVADFRKPEIDLDVKLTPLETAAGQTLNGSIQAQFFFGAPASDVSLNWTLYKQRVNFPIPGYQVGPSNSGWLLPPWAVLPLGEPVEFGESRTDENGSLLLNLPTQFDPHSQDYTLEVTLIDETNFPVSSRSTVRVHPGPYYLGVQPSSWSGPAGESIEFSVQEVDWEGQSVPRREIIASFNKVIWVEVQPLASSPYQIPQFDQQLTVIDEQNLTLDSQGRGRVAFTPPEPGTYQMTVRDDEVLTDVLLWIGGSGQVTWPSLPNQHIQLTSDKMSYRAGETAQVFIPNPLGASAKALITVERSRILRSWVIDMSETGENFSIPLGEDDAPTIYLSVTLLGDGGDGSITFRQGYLQLDIDPEALSLQIALRNLPEQTGPGETVTFDLEVTDTTGRPVSGEFSVAVVDLATLALAAPNSPDILDAFYANQPLGIRTSLGLAASPQRQLTQADGVGGGGGFETLIVRDEFEDTAFWRADFVTNEIGLGQIQFQLPDNLTTWQLDLRGVTEDTRVGQTTTELVTSKDLLIRPVIPRFLVVEDHIVLGAVIHNNTEASLDIRVSLETQGIIFDDPSTATQSIIINAGERERVDWWGTVEGVPQVDLLFTAQGNGRAGVFQDAVRPAPEGIPVRHYTVPNTFASAGTLTEAGERLEVISAPRTFAATGGELQLELAPSLASGVIQALEVLEQTQYESTEAVVSRFLPNLELYQSFEDLGLAAPGLQERLNRTLVEGIDRLSQTQNQDGGWNWWPVTDQARASSDPYISAYALLGLVRAEAAGIIIDRGVSEAAIAYLQATLFSPQMLSDPSFLDRLAFQHYVLAEAGMGEIAGVMSLYNVRDQLNPWAVAYLALTVERLSPGDSQTSTLLADLEGSAVRTGTGAHWALRESGGPNMDTTVFNTAVAVFALAQNDPATPVLSEAIRFLMSHRVADGGWSSSYDSAWSLLALTEFVRGTGELGGDFRYGASLNNIPIAEATTGAPPLLTPVQVTVPFNDFHAGGPNGLLIHRASGPGRLYYRTNLVVERSVDAVEPLQRGIEVERRYLPYGFACLEGGCEAIVSGRGGELVSVKLTLVLEEDAYYLLVEDHPPAGGEIVDVSLQTSQLGAVGTISTNEYPFGLGWGLSYFEGPQISSERILWTADYLPAGTYELTYTLSLNHRGEFRILPAHARQLYFPEVQGGSPGGVFQILP